MLNLPAIPAGNCLHCDAHVARQNLSVVGIAHQHIKERRARKAVPVQPGGVVADYLPFYFAPRSPMLFAIHHGQVTGYDGGQLRVVYLVSSVRQVIAQGLPFCFTVQRILAGRTTPPVEEHQDWYF